MSLKIEKHGSVLHLSLNRPEAHNALDQDLISALTKTFGGIKKDLSISAVLFKGEGPSFCAGGDLNWMRKSIKFTRAQNLKDTQKLSDMYEAIFQCPAPIVGIVHGNVMGGGVGLAAVCDIVVAETETKFSFSEVRLGLVPSIISPYVLRKIPESEARPLMLTAEFFKAAHAKDIGLVHFVGSRAEAEKYSAEKIKLIVSNGPEATRITKSLINKIQTSIWTERRKVTVRTIAERRASQEGQEGMGAFFEKRPPAWRRGE